MENEVRRTNKEATTSEIAKEDKMARNKPKWKDPKKISTDKSHNIFWFISSSCILAKDGRLERFRDKVKQ